MLVRKFEEKDLQALIEFNISVFENRDNVEESISYRFKNNPFTINKAKEILIAKDNSGNIIGQLLVMPSSFFFNSVEYPAYFGMDYFVKKEARSSLAGVLLANKYKDLIYNFGIGLSDASLAIISAFGIKVIGYMTKFIKLNLGHSIVGLLLSLIQKEPKKYIFPGIIGVKGGKFKRVFNPEDIVSDSGSWNPSIIEFTRSKEFLDWRFFYYSEKYFVYKFYPDDEENIKIPNYFVVRPIFWKNVNCLLLVDYRFDASEKYMFSTMLESVIKLSRKLRMAATITGCSLPGFDFCLRKKWFFKFGRKMEIVTNYKIDKIEPDTNTVFSTFADSDGDFYYGNYKW